MKLCCIDGLYDRLVIVDDRWNVLATPNEWGSLPTIQKCETLYSDTLRIFVESESEIFVEMSLGCLKDSNGNAYPGASDFFNAIKQTLTSPKVVMSVAIGLKESTDQNFELVSSWLNSEGIRPDRIVRIVKYQDPTVRITRAGSVMVGFPIYIRSVLGNLDYLSAVNSVTERLLGLLNPRRAL
jgi:hypothetical protein